MRVIVSLIVMTIFSGAAMAQEFDWVNGFHGEGFSDLGYEVITDSDGNVYNTGSFDGTVDFDPGPGVVNLTSGGSWGTFITKFNSAGELIWAYELDGERSEGTGIAMDDDGNLYVSGSFEGTVDFDPSAGTFEMTSNGGNDIYLVKLNGDGEFIWAKSIGGEEYDYGTFVSVDNENNVVLSGKFRMTADFNPDDAEEFNMTAVGGNDIYILKLNSEGDFIWAKSMGSEEGDYSSSVQVDDDGNIFATGSFSNTVDFDPGAGTTELTAMGDYSCFILKLDGEGNFAWAKSIESTITSHATCLEVDPFGNILLCGEYEGLADFDPGAGVNNQTSVGTTDAFVLKLDLDGEFLWVNTMGGIATEWATSIIADDAGDIYFSGKFEETVDFDSGDEVFDLVSNGGSDIYISKLDSEGSFLWAKSMGGVGSDYGYSLKLDPEDNIYLTGAFSNTVDFNSDGTAAELTSSGAFDIFLLKLNQLTLGLDNAMTENTESVVYPNPSTGFFTVKTNIILTNYQMSVYDIQGKQVDYTVVQNGNALQIIVNENQKGLTFVKIVSDQGIFLEKVVVQ